MNFELAMFTLFIIKYTPTNCLAWDMLFIPHRQKELWQNKQSASKSLEGLIFSSPAQQMRQKVTTSSGRSLGTAGIYCQRDYQSLLVYIILFYLEIPGQLEGTIKRIVLNNLHCQAILLIPMGLELPSLAERHTVTSLGKPLLSLQGAPGGTSDSPSDNDIR